MCVTHLLVMTTDGVEQLFEMTAAEVAADAVGGLLAEIRRRSTALANETGLEPEAVEVGLLHRVAGPLLGEIYERGQQRRTELLAALPRGEGARQLMTTMGVARTSIYGAFGRNAGWRDRDRARRG